MKFQIIKLIIIFGLMHACKPPASDTGTRKNNVPIDSLFERYYEERMERYPLEATMAGDYRFNNLLPNDLTQSFKEDLKHFYTRYQNLLKKYDRNQLSETEQESYDILNRECVINLEGLEFQQELLPVNQIWSLHLQMGQLASGKSIQPFRNTEDYDNWLQRLEAFVVWCDTAIANMRKGMKTGYVLPGSLINKVIPQMAEFASGPVINHLFYAPVRSFPDNIEPAERTRLKQDFSDMIEKQIIPAFSRLHHFLQNEYLPAGRESSGIGNLPDGDKWYQFLIRYYTHTDLTPDEIFQIGQQEVERISAEMEKVKAQTGFEGSLKSFFNYIRTNKELMPYTKPEQVIDHFKEIYATVRPNLPGLFDLVPKTPFEIRRTEAFREKTASAEYNPGSSDGSRPGIFYVPVPDARTYNVFADEDLFLHEAIPGHHFQISLQQENERLPKFRKILWYSAYGEGWALYSESLGKELGLYNDPYQYFGMLNSEMHRAVRLVVDVGIHTKGWTREQAIQYSLDHEAEPESSIVAEIERYMAGPAQALSYKIGQLKIQELKAKAEKTLGEKFDIRQFHNILLESGCLPLSLMEKKINDWISTAQDFSFR
ncbi:MAG: DUF885 domain-containing protein [Bacteroidales bacterium]|nr:DUF885 domain-containing protein [Bacteroidales bacterium]